MTDAERLSGISQEEFCQRLNLPPERVEAALRLGEMTGRLAPVAVPLTWLQTELDRLDATFTLPDERLLTGERVMLAALAVYADADGALEMPRRLLTKCTQLDSHQISAGYSWLRWRDSLTVRRSSESGTPRIDRVQLHRWPHATDRHPAISSG